MYRSVVSWAIGYRVARAVLERIAAVELRPRLALTTPFVVVEPTQTGSTNLPLARIGIKNRRLTMPEHARKLGAPQREPLKLTVTK